MMKIISGGQTGADRAGLDAAIHLNIPHGGWCPRGRRAEGSPIPLHYVLEETDSADWMQRTSKNVLEADLSLIFNFGQNLSGGTALTKKTCRELKKPFMIIDPLLDPIVSVRTWFKLCDAKVINIAGPRESKQPGIYVATFDFLVRMLR
jgi:hypothetical protein